MVLGSLKGFGKGVCGEIFRLTNHPSPKHVTDKSSLGSIRGLWLPSQLSTVFVYFIFYIVLLTSVMIIAAFVYIIFCFHTMFIIVLFLFCFFYNKRQLFLYIVLLVFCFSFLW